MEIIHEVDLSKPMQELQMALKYTIPQMREFILFILTIPLE